MTFTSTLEFDGTKMKLGCTLLGWTLVLISLYHSVLLLAVYSFLDVRIFFVLVHQQVHFLDLNQFSNIVGIGIFDSLSSWHEDHTGHCSRRSSCQPQQNWLTFERTVCSRSNKWPHNENNVLNQTWLLCNRLGRFESDPFLALFVV